MRVSSYPLSGPPGLHQGGFRGFQNDAVGHATQAPRPSRACALRACAMRWVTSVALLLSFLGLPSASCLSLHALGVDVIPCRNHDKHTLSLDVSVLSDRFYLTLG